jgi:PD-(D/E)XK nuclease superfamily protein
MYLWRSWCAHVRSFMNINNRGLFSELEVAKYFINQDYEVFTALGGFSSFDMVVYKDKQMWRVSVKSTETIDLNSGGSYAVRIGQRTRDSQKPFDPTTSDILAVYIVPEDRVVIFNSKDITNKYQINIKPVAVVETVNTSV